MYRPISRDVGLFDLANQMNGNMKFLCHVIISTVSIGYKTEKPAYLIRLLDLHILQK